jgi:hypothetical protein
MWKMQKFTESEPWLKEARETRSFGFALHLFESAPALSISHASVQLSEVLLNTKKRFIVAILSSRIEGKMECMR